MTTEAKLSLLCEHCNSRISKSFRVQLGYTPAVRCCQQGQGVCASQSVKHAEHSQPNKAWCRTQSLRPPTSLCTQQHMGSLVYQQASRCINAGRSQATCKVTSCRRKNRGGCLFNHSSRLERDFTRSSQKLQSFLSLSLPHSSTDSGQTSVPGLHPGRARCGRQW